MDELGGNALLDKGHIVVYEPHDFVVVLRLFVTYAPALNNFELGEGHLYGFDAFAVYGGRKDERIGFFIVSVRADAMVHGLTLHDDFFHTLQHPDSDLPVSEHKAEEFGFGSMVGALFLKICGEVFGYFPFGFPAGDFGYTAVMFPFKIGGTYVFGAVQVFT